MTTSSNRFTEKMTESTMLLLLLLQLTTKEGEGQMPKMHLSHRPRVLDRVVISEEIRLITPALKATEIRTWKILLEMAFIFENDYQGQSRVLKFCHNNWKETIFQVFARFYF